jgi:hypothetical protein
MAEAAKPTAAMQAVVVIRAVWETDHEIAKKNGLPNPTQVWSKPDARTGSLELRRITTRETIPGGRVSGGRTHGFL